MPDNEDAHDVTIQHAKQYGVREALDQRAANVMFDNREQKWTVGDLRQRLIKLLQESDPKPGALLVVVTCCFANIPRRGRVEFKPHSPARSCFE